MNRCREMNLWATMHKLFSITWTQNVLYLLASFGRNSQLHMRAGTGICILPAATPLRDNCHTHEHAHLPFCLNLPLKSRACNCHTFQYGQEGLRTFSLLLFNFRELVSPRETSYCANITCLESFINFFQQKTLICRSDHLGCNVLLTGFPSIKTSKIGLYIVFPCISELLTP